MGPRPSLFRRLHGKNKKTVGHTPEIESVIAIRPARTESPSQSQDDNGGQSSQVVASNVSDEPSPALPTLAAGPTSETNGSALQERLWNDAYDALKENETATVDLYEKILAMRLVPPGSTGHSEACTIEIEPDREQRRPQMQSLVQTALDQRERSADRMQRANAGFQIFDSLKGVIEKSVQASPEASVAWVGVCFTVELLMNPVTESIANREALQYVLTRMEWYWHLANLLLDESRATQPAIHLRAQLEISIGNLYQKLLLIQMKSVCRYSRSRVSLMARDLFKLDDWGAQLENIKDVERKIEQDSKLFNSEEARSRSEFLHNSSMQLEHKLDDIRDALNRQMQQQDELWKSQEYQSCVRDLRITDPRDDKARIEDTKGGLLFDASRWILRHPDFLRWNQDVEGRPLWINGLPGKGKTMLMCGLINSLQESQHDELLIFFFCQQSDNRLNHATGVLRGLMYQLISKQPSLAKHLLPKYKDGGKGLFEDINAWSALSDAFSKILQDTELPVTTLIVDALDECAVDLPRLLDFIIRTSSSRIKWLVSSRPWPSVEEPLRRESSKVPISLELTEQSVGGAVRSYIDYKVNKLAELKRYDETLRHTVQDHLLSNSGDTFLWVSLVCEELAKDGVTRNSTRRRLRSFPPGLDALYERMLQHINQSSDADLCRRILVLAAIAYRPLALVELRSLDQVLDNALEGDDDADYLSDLISHCGSFLTCRTGVLNLVHQSARDFVLKASPGTILSSSTGESHCSLCLRSIRCLTTSLRRNIYGLTHSGPHPAETPPPSPDPLATVRYSCVYWINHLVEGLKLGVNLFEDYQSADLLTKFLEEKLLQWIEAVGLLGSITHLIRSVLELQKQLQSAAVPSRFKDLVYDLSRFTRYHKTGIIMSPLQVYSSALIFSPTMSLIRQLYRSEEPSWIMVKPVVDNEWDVCVQILDGHRSSVIDYVFKSHGQELISTSDDGTIKIWDTSTGACSKTLDGFRPVHSIKVSSDNKHMAVQKSCDLELWDIDEFRCIQTFMVDISGSIICFTFIPGGQSLVALTMEEGIGEVWDIAPGTCRRIFTDNPMDGSATFSSDGRLLAALGGNSNGTYRIKIWDIEARTCRLELEPPVSGHRKLIFAPNSQWLASCLVPWRHLNSEERKNISIWDVNTASVWRILECDGIVLTLAFSPDSRRLLSLSEVGTIAVWDTNGYIRLKNVMRHYPGKCPFRFAPDGLHIAVSLEGDGIEIWDTDLMMDMVDSRAGSGFTSITFSQSGQQLATVSRDSAIRIWDTHTGAHTQTLMGHTDRVRAINFSPDGQWLASGSMDHTVKVWNLKTGKCFVSHLEGSMPKFPSSVKFTSDGQQVAFASEHGIVHVLDIRSFETRTYVADSSGLPAASRTGLVAVSPDGQLVASGWALDRAIIWNLQTGIPLPTADHIFLIELLSFTSDSQHLLSLSGFRDVRVFDTNTGACVQTLDHHRDFCKLQRMMGRDVVYSISEDLSWLTYHGREFLWLPPNFRPVGGIWGIDVFGDAVAIRSSGGRSPILRFRPDEIP